MNGGYTFEAYDVFTDDGWKLTNFRLGKVGVTPDSDKLPVHFQHGLGMDAASWLRDQRTKRQGGYNYKPIMMELVDQGYDVWMGNNRGG